MEERHFDHPALAGSFAREQSLQDGLIGCHTRSDVANRHANARSTFFRAADVAKPALCLDEQVIGFLIAVGAIFSVTGD